MDNKRKFYILTQNFFRHIFSPDLKAKLRGPSNYAIPSVNVKLVELSTFFG